MYNYKDKSEFQYLTLTRYWSVPIFASLVGTTLPFWLQPPGFTFKWFAAFEFLAATALFHAAFLLLIFFNEKKSDNKFRNRLLLLAVIFIVIVCMIGLHLNSELVLHKGVPKFIFLALGFATFFVGLLYVAPPFSFNERIGGEIVIAEGLGMLTVIGAYLAQFGDITRTVYIASLPIVAVTGLWVWIIEIISKSNDEKFDKKSLVIDFGLNFSARFGVILIIAVYFATILFALVSSSLNPLILVMLIFILLIRDIIVSSRKNYLYPDKMKSVEKKAMLLHSATCIIIIISSLLIMIK